MTPAQVLEGAKTWLARRDITYSMGAENTGKGGSLDCSAFVWHVLGETKRDRNTDWLLGDATGKCTKVKRIPAPVPGCIAVYGTWWEKVPGAPTKRHAGHTGIVVDPATKTVIDCSSSQNGIRQHVQSVLFDGTKDGRKPVFCVPV